MLKQNLKAFNTQAYQVNPTDVAKELEQLVDSNIGVFFSNLAKITNENLIDVLLELSNQAFLQAIDRLSVHRVYNAMAETPSDIMTDFLQRTKNLDHKYANKLHALMNKKEQNEFLELSQYNDMQAGAYMQTEMLTATLEDTIADVKNNIHIFRQDEPYSNIIKLFVTNQEQNFLATLHFSDLILYEPEQTIQTIVEQLKPHHPLSVHPTTSIDEVIRLFNEFDLSVLAVVDEDNILKGRILYDDIYELIQKINTDQVYKLAGVDDEAEDESFSSAQRSRLIWLFINLGTVFISSFVIDSFKETIASYIAIAVLLPLVAALGGNAGMQAVTVTIRKLTLGEIDFSQGLHVLKRESAIVLVNGFAIALSVAFISYIWFHDEMLSLVIGIAMFVNLLFIGSVGALIPLLLKKVGVDPAIASSIILTTTSDIFGFFIFLFLAEKILM